MKFRPQVKVGGKTVPHYIAPGSVPPAFTQVVIENTSKSTILGIKMTPTEFIAAGQETFEIYFNKDLRLGSLTSLLKCSHLTLFEMLGYRYALSPGGHFLGNFVLGKFFQENRQLSKSEVIEAAVPHFRQFLDMVRPVV